MLQLLIESCCGHDFLWMFAHGDLMLLFDDFIMDYFCDFEIYDSMSIRVGYLHVVTGSCLQWGSGP